MTLPAIHIEGLHKTFRSGFFRREAIGAVAGVDLRCEPGECWALLGPNGAGKTTTLHCLMGLLRPDGGRVEIFGQAAEHASSRARVGFQSEIFYGYPRLSGAACLDFYARLAGLPDGQRATRVQETMAHMGLGNVGRKRVGAYSKGMAQRLGLAQSLLHDPDVIVWDEPTSGLDPEGRAFVAELLLDLKRRGKTVLLSSHVLPDIERVCDKVAIMRAGKILLAGGLLELSQQQGKNLEALYLDVMRRAAP